MRILIINDMFECGGAEIMARLQKRILENNGHDVLLITLDTYINERKSREKGHITIGRKYNILESFVYRYLCDYIIKHRIENVIKSYSPDIIHLHNIYCSSNAVYSALKGRCCIQTVHDYSITCVKSTSIYRNGELCRGYYCNNCIKQCLGGNTKEKIVFLGRYFAMHLNNKLRKKYIQVFISPSKSLKEICNLNGFNTVHLANPLELSIQNIKKTDNRFSNNEKKFLYFGAINRVKGVKQLIEAFNKFSSEKSNVKLLLAGTVKEDFTEEFNYLLSSNKKIEYLGQIAHDEMKELLKTINTVVIPSLWIENFPGTLLESIACGCLVITSDRGGMPEIISDKNMLFNILKKTSIIKALEYVFALDAEKSYKVIRENQTKILKECSIEQYYDSLMKLYTRMLKG